MRFDGNRCPTTNQFGIPCAAGVEFVLTYTAGRTTPVELAMAAAELACELKKACNGGECALPAHVTGLARRGVTMEFSDLTELLKSGSTGLPMVDHAISVHGNCQHATMHDPAAMHGWATT